MWIKRFFAILVVLTGIKAFAGNDGYFTTYNHHIEAGEWELMFMNDYTVPSTINRESGEGHYFSQMIELEYGVTDRFATELMIEGFEDLESGKSMFTGFRWENRFKLFKKETFFNPLVYMEYEHLQKETRYKMEVSGWIKPPYKEEDSGEERDERILETRIILSHDFKNTNIAFNWINETDLRNSTTDFGYSIGVLHYIGSGHEHHHNRSSFISLSALGIEFYGGVGDSKKFSFRPADQQHYIQPLLVFHLSSGLMLHTGFAWGLTNSSDRFLGRVAIGIEF